MNSFISDIDSIRGLAEQTIPNIKIIEKKATPCGTYCSIEDGTPVLYWDPLMVDYFEKTFFLQDTFPYDEETDKKLMLELTYNFLGVLFDHLAQRNEDQPEISSCFRQEAIKYHYPYFEHIYQKADDVSEWAITYYLQSGIFKLLIMYHELAHLVFYLHPEERQTWTDIVKGNLKESEQRGLIDIMLKASKTDRKTFSKLLNCITDQAEGISYLEELAADAYAVSHTYSTAHLNLSMIEHTTLSDHIITGLLRYLHLTVRYAYVIKLWNNFLPMFVTKHQMTIDFATGETQKLRELSYIREGICSLFLSVNVLQMDVSQWNYDPPGGITLGNSRLKRITNVISTNNDIFEKAVQIAFSNELFNEVLSKTPDINISYPTISDDIQLITWLSIQYHNNCGLQKYKQHQLDDAIREHHLALSASVEYLGDIHRLTARVYNNICSCYLQKYIEDKNNNERGLSVVEHIELATYHSEQALKIVDHLSNKDDLQIAVIYQNAGEVCTARESFDQAIQYYLMAKEMKGKLEPEYLHTHAVTDFSLACAYFATKQYLNAKRCCKSALDYFNANSEEEKEKAAEAQALYDQIKWKMDPGGGGMMDILNTLMNGGCVNLDQYNDWDEIRAMTKTDKDSNKKKGKSKGEASKTRNFIDSIIHRK